MSRRPVLVLAAVILLLAGCTAAGAATSTVALHAGDSVMVTCDGSRGLAHTGTGARWVVSCRGTAPSSSAASSSPSTPASTPPSSSSSSPTASPTTSSSPPPSGFPDASNTGVPAGTALKAVPGQVTSGTGWHWDSRGWVEIDGNGAVFSGYTLTAGIDVTASNVTISNDQITLQGNSWAIGLRHTTGVTIQDCTISSPSETGANRLQEGIRGIYGDDTNVTILRNNIFHADSGINHFDQGGLIQDNYIHDFGMNTGDHINGIQLGSGAGPLMTIRHNTILNQYQQTDAIMLATDDGPETNRVIDNNLIGGGGYSFYGAGGPSDKTSKIVVTNNVFSTQFWPSGGFWGPEAYFVVGGPGNVWAGNAFDNGQPVNP